jgi:hypothetical protein
MIKNIQDPHDKRRMEMRDNLRDIYLQDRLQNWPIPAQRIGNKIVVKHKNFPRLHIEVSTEREAAERFLGIIEKQLVDAPIEMIDHLFDQFLA